MDIWYDCTECVFASNSAKNAKRHEDEKGHQVASSTDPVPESVKE